MTTADLLAQARKLSREEQLKLAHDLWIEADGPYDDPADVDQAWTVEVERRVRGIVDGSQPAFPTPRSVADSTLTGMARWLPGARR